MWPRPTSAIETLNVLLQQWIDTAFLGQDRPVPELNHLWRTLAHALGETQHNSGNSFHAEIAQLRLTEQAGAPPIRALEQRLRDLVAAGLRETFLVVAVRQGLDQLISKDFPATFALWRDLADAMLPTEVQFSKTGDDLHSSYTTYGPNA